MLKEGSLKRLLSMGIPILLLDMIVKWLVQAHIPIMSWLHPFYPYGGIGVFRNWGGIQFSIVHATNQGAAWGLFADYQPYLLVCRSVVVLFLIIYQLFINRSYKLQAPLALIICGAIGNMIDILFYGAVIDMWNFILWGYPFAIFNIADACITLGVIWFVITSLIEKRNRNKAPAPVRGNS